MGKQQLGLLASICPLLRNCWDCGTELPHRSLCWPFSWVECLQIKSVLVLRAVFCVLCTIVSAAAGVRYEQKMQFSQSSNQILYHLEGKKSEILWNCCLLYFQIIMFAK